MSYKDFILQVGPIRTVARSVYIKMLKILKGRQSSLLQKLWSGEEYCVHFWDPSGTEVFVTNCKMDWGLERLFFLSTTANTGILVDIGAHTGIYTKLMIPICKGSLMIDTSEKCCRLALDEIANQHTNKNMRVIHNPCWSSSGVTIEIEINEASGFSDSNIDRKSGGVPMKSVCIDDLIESETGVEVSCIKIDVDGPDIEVLNGAERTIIKNRPSILIENTSEYLLQFAKRHNYKAFCACIPPDGDKPWSTTLVNIASLSDLKILNGKMSLLIPEEKAFFLENLSQVASPYDQRKAKLFEI
jgi:FkbM family methyltransferase